MGKEELSKRATWQDYSGENAGKAERNFFDVFREAFKGTDFKVRANPNEFKEIYVNVELSKDVLSEIYTPDAPIKKHGITPDYAIAV